MIDAYKRFLRNYANFSGRSTASDYWFVFLANILIGFCLGVIGGIIPELSKITIVVAYVYNLVTLIPGIAIVVRRLHDINKSGAWYFINFVPFVGTIIMLIFLCSASVNENNKYGERV